MIPVILAGGTGSRLWPLSRRSLPKQFLRLNSDDTMFQETILRAKSIGTNDPIVVCNQDARFIVCENLEEKSLSANQILLEPMGRNTAPAIAVASFSALKIEDDPVLLVLPADHVIQDLDKFKEAVDAAESLANEGLLVTFGVKPEKPHTGYGYIECGEQINDLSFKISSFKEKPTLDVAKEFLKQGNYFWNSGMFVFKASKYLEELAKNAPDILKFAEISIKNARKERNFLCLEEESFYKCQNTSIDYAVMETTSDSAVVILDAACCDVGSWDALWDISEKDEDGNAARGDVILKDTQNSYIRSEDKKIMAIGLEDVIIVDTKDAMLVANKGRVEEVKALMRINKE